MSSNNKIENEDYVVVAYLQNLWHSKYYIIVPTQNNIINTQESNTLSEYIKQNKEILSTFGYQYYTLGNEEKGINDENINEDDIKDIIQYKNNIITHKIAYTVVYPKHKSGNYKDPENFRYLVNHSTGIKILDRIWCIELLNNYKYEMIDHDVFKTNIHKNFSESCLIAACKNTESRQNVVMLDIAKAYDSFEWDITEKLLLSNITRKINDIYAKKKVNEYMVMLKNRKLYYKNNLINVSKSIPTGLPSSIIIITLVFEQIIYEWLEETKYVLNQDLLLNIYVDDIYIKILNLNEKENIIKTIIDIFKKYKFNINLNKSKIDKLLKPNVTFYDYINSFFWSPSYLQQLGELKETDYYLGIPFTRDVKLYSKLILNEYNRKYNTQYNWNYLYDNIKETNIGGFLRYKLYPFIKNNLNDIPTNDKLKHFIDNFILEK